MCVCQQTVQFETALNGGDGPQLATFRSFSSQQDKKVKITTKISTYD